MVAKRFLACISEYKAGSSMCMPSLGMVLGTRRESNLLSRTTKLLANKKTSA
jgi:hypothetical protein